VCLKAVHLCSGCPVGGPGRECVGEGASRIGSDAHHACTQRHIHQQRTKPRSIQARVCEVVVFKSSAQASICRRKQPGLLLRLHNSLCREKEMLLFRSVAQTNAVYKHAAAPTYTSSVLQVLPNCVCNRRKVVYYQHKKWSDKLFDATSRPLFCFCFPLFFGRSPFDSVNIFFSESQLHMHKHRTQRANSTPPAQLEHNSTQVVQLQLGLNPNSAQTKKV